MIIIPTTQHRQRPRHFITMREETDIEVPALQGHNKHSRISSRKPLTDIILKLKGIKVNEYDHIISAHGWVNKSGEHNLTKLAKNLCELIGIASSPLPSFMPSSFSRQILKNLTKQNLYNLTGILSHISPANIFILSCFGGKVLQNLKEENPSSADTDINIYTNASPYNISLMTTDNHLTTELLEKNCQEVYNQIKGTRSRLSITPSGRNLENTTHNRDHFTQELLSSLDKNRLLYLFVQEIIHFNFTQRSISHETMVHSLIKTIKEKGYSVNDTLDGDWNASTLLFNACNMQDLISTKALINAGADVNQAMPDCGTTPLYTACQQGHLDIVKELIATKKVNINQPILYDGSTPLFKACQKGYLDIVEELIDAGADVNQATSDNGTTPLYIACQEGHLDIVKKLIATKKVNINQARSTDGTTPLFKACQKGYLDIVEELIDAGADVNQATSDNGTTPLIMACQKGHLDIVKKLIATKKVNINQATSDDGTTPLIMACQEGHLDIVKELIDAGADINQATSDNGTTPLIIACQEGHLDIVKKLIATKKVNVNQATSDDGTTPLIMACQEGDLDIVDELINAGADINQPMHDGTTPLSMACKGGHLDIVKKLIATKKVNINQPILYDGSTALFMACYNGHLDIVEELIEAGADVNKTTTYGTTALAIAHQEGYLDIMNTLNEAIKKSNLNTA